MLRLRRTLRVEGFWSFSAAGSQGGAPVLSSTQGLKLSLLPYLFLLKVEKGVTVAVFWLPGYVGPKFSVYRSGDRGCGFLSNLNFIAAGLLLGFISKIWT